jgi:hypothetical protein
MKKPNSFTISFLSGNRKEVPVKSSLNWWNSNGNVSDGDAYIPILKSHHKLYRHLIPEKVNRFSTPIKIIWDDGLEMNCAFEGGSYVNGVIMEPYNKIASIPQKSILGNYLWGRMGCPPPEKGRSRPITRMDLEAYGRTDLILTKVGENIYHGDFSDNSTRTRDMLEN